jgi:hypothetical protein
MDLQKISKSIISALENLRKATEAQIKKNEKEVMLLTWKASSDLEYGLFLFGLYRQEENRSSSWKLPISKQPKIESILKKTQEMLKVAEKNFELENLEEAYKNMWIAKGELLRINDLFEKKRKTQKNNPQG